MIKSIYIPKQPNTGIEKPLEFNSLDKINVIIGNNNAGKSTIANAINSMKFSFGLNINDLKTDFEQDDQYIDIIWEVYKKHFGYYEYFYIDVLKENEDLFANELKSKSLSRNLETMKFTFDDFYKHCSNQSKTNIKVILDRLNFHGSVPLKDVDRIDTNAQGLANLLIKMKTSKKRSPEQTLLKEITEAYNIITGLDFDVELIKSNIQIAFSNSSLDFHPSVKSGSGLNPLLFLISMILTNKDCDLFVIDEIEKCIHPNALIKLLLFFREETSSQFLITTHSESILSSNLVDQFYYCFYSDGINIENETSKSQIFNLLGFPVNQMLSSDAIILVEGTTDKLIYMRLLNLMGLKRMYSVKFMHLRGDNLKHIDPKIFENHKLVAIILDKDPKSDLARKEFIESSKELGYKLYILERYSVENYIPLSLWRKVFPKFIKNEITEIEHNESIEKQNITLNNYNLKKGVDKVANEIALDDISGTDLEKILLEIKSFIEK